MENFKIDKFVVQRRYGELASFKPIQIRMSTYELIQQMREETGNSVVDLVDAMVRFCSDRLVVEEPAE